MNKSEKQHITETINYQEGSVVSRTVLSKDAGSVTLFAFDVGEGLSEHTTPYDALVHILEGEMDITISGETTRVTPGEIITLPANEPHALDAPHRCKMMLTMIKSD